MSAGFCTTTKDGAFCELIPKCGFTMNDSIAIAKKRLMEAMHDDPEPGASWGSCQSTAATSLIDWQAHKKESHSSFSFLTRYLLAVDRNGFSPSTNLIQDRIADALLVCREKNAAPSKKKVERITKLLQESLRKDIAGKLGLKLRRDGDEIVLVDHIQAFQKSMDAVLTHKPSILLAILSGTPSHTEVRSFIGAEHIVPYRYDDFAGRYRLDEDNEFFRISGNARRILTPRGGLLIRDGKHVVQRLNRETGAESFRLVFGNSDNSDGIEKVVREIPRVRRPLPGENFFVLHVGFPVQNHCEIDRDLGNIISALKLDTLNPIQFAYDRYMLMQRGGKEINRETLDALPHSHLSLFHFSHILNFDQTHFDAKHIELPNCIEIKNAKMPFQPKDKKHHPLLLHDHVIDPYEAHAGLGLNIEKAERGVRFFFRVAKTDDGKFDLERSYIRMEQVSDAGANTRIEDAEDAVNRADKFMRILAMYHRVGFCPRTRLLMEDAGLTEACIEDVRAHHLAKLIDQFREGVPLREVCKESSILHVMKHVPDSLHPLINGTTVVFQDQHYTFYSLRLVKTADNIIDTAHSYVKIERFTNDKDNKFVLINDERVVNEYALRFLNVIKMHLEKDFQPETRSELLDAGIDESTLEEIEASLPDLHFGQGMRGEFSRNSQTYQGKISP